MKPERPTTRDGRSHRVMRSLRHLFWSHETHRVLCAGLLTWAATSAALAWLTAQGFEYMSASTLRSTALAGGFGLGAVTVVLYGTMRSLADARRLTGAIGAVAIYALPVLLGIFVPSLLSIPGARFAAQSGRMLEVGLFLPVFAHAAFTAARAGIPGRPPLRRVAPAIALIALAFSLVLGRIGTAGTATSNPPEDITAALERSAGTPF